MRVWQRVEGGTGIHISARPAGGDWNARPTQALALDGLSRSGRYRYGDASLTVPLPERFDVPVPTAAMTFDGDFTAAERAALEGQIEREFTRAATFFARTYGVAAPGITIVVERNGVAAAFGGGVMYLSDGSVAAIAHEYVHALQEQLQRPNGFPEGGVPPWITEGIATYFEMRYDEAVQLRTFEEARFYWLRSARFAEGPLEGSWGAGGVGAPPWYGVAMLATEKLVERADEAALFEFYRQLDEGSPWQSAFAAVFGVTTDDSYASFEPYRLEVAPRLLYFRGTVLGPGGAPIEGLMVSAKRPGDIFSWMDTTDAHGAFNVPAETYAIAGEAFDEDGQPMEFNEEAPVVLELRTGNCEIFGYLGPSGSMVEHREEARVFIVQGLTITGIVINLPVDPWSLPVVTGCGTFGVETSTSE